MLLLASGCSHTAGAEILEDRVCSPHLSYSAIVAKQFQMEYKNISVPGAGNEHITKATVNWVLNQSDKIKKDLFVLVGWSTVPRFSFYHNQRPAHTTPGLIGESEIIETMQRNSGCKADLAKFIELYYSLVDSETYMNDWFNDIVYIDSFMRLNKIPYLMVNTAMSYSVDNIKSYRKGQTAKANHGFYPNQYGIPPCDPAETPDVKSIIASTSYYQPFDFDSSMFGICKNLTQNDWQHFKEDGHKKFGNVLIPIVDNILKKYKLAIS
ncbi:MAG: hypothetical protein HN353_01850 [Bdellovibrionales bacterium]|jgi:hypothetical protein|nr:hypothetical protein [Bdellovibrionales bacterium]MBT3525375.1 hypothetical protein [Bdellovibrionales bacterium]MBT7670462.1 hypothetical protein [Bdellovibrionales bacterium]MBT7765985.1 hypothetical protein [Bdellovibrionales bacterium]